MSADYYECNKCGNGFPDDSDYCIYCDCGAHFCSAACAKPIYEWTTDEIEPDEQYEICVSCVVCRNEHCTDYALLNFLLENYSLTREKATEMYFEKNKPEIK